MSVDATASDPLTEAVVAYTGYGRAKMPLDDVESARQVGERLGVDLIPEVDRVLADSESVDMSDIPIPSDDAGTIYRQRLGAQRPDLSALALAALSNRWFYRRLWLDASPSVPHPRVQYFVRFGYAGGVRTPTALYRRESIGDQVVDTVLKDVGLWRDDRNRVVWAHVVNRLESDIEPVTAKQAEEFEQMVARREYRPFSTP